MASQSQAYDLSRYEPKVAEQPKVRVIKRAQPVKSVYGVRPITLVMAAMIVVSITALLLYNNAMIAEISAEITSATTELELLENENARLNRELDAKMSNEVIAETAVNELGAQQAGKLSGGICEPFFAGCSYCQEQRRDKYFRYYWTGYHKNSGISEVLSNIIYKEEDSRGDMRCPGCKTTGYAVGF